MSVVMGWLLSVVGIVLIGVLVDLILPEGEMQKYVKAVFSIFVVFVMVSPVLKIDLNKINFDAFVYNKNSVQVNENFLKNYNNAYKENLEKVCEQQLENAGFSGVCVEICLNLSNSKFEIKEVQANLANLVINANKVHIDKYQEIKSVIISVLGIESDKVVISG
ncbi:MAG: stage III sporulation protein AF [Christensenellales bacterium]